MDNTTPAPVVAPVAPQATKKTGKILGTIGVILALLFSGFAAISVGTSHSVSQTDLNSLQSNLSSNFQNMVDTASSNAANQAVQNYIASQNQSSSAGSVGSSSGISSASSGSGLVFVPSSQYISGYNLQLSNYNSVLSVVTGQLTPSNREFKEALASQVGIDKQLLTISNVQVLDSRISASSLSDKQKGNFDVKAFVRVEYYSSDRTNSNVVNVGYFLVDSPLDEGNFNNVLTLTPETFNFVFN